MISSSTVPQKASALVQAGAVQLIDPSKALVRSATGSLHVVEVVGEADYRCSCVFAKLYSPLKVCSHVLAVAYLLQQRMVCP